MAAALSGFLAVGLGAFGAHALKSHLAPDMLAIYQTAVQYHFHHALALLACGVLMRLGLDNVFLRASGILFMVGLMMFCGSLYLLAITGERWLGAVAPIGGLSFIGGWLMLALAIFRESS